MNRLRLLQRICLLGVSLSVAKPLLVGATDARCADVQREVLALVARRLRALDQEIAELQQLRADVEGYQRRLAACYTENATSPEAFRECSDLTGCLVGHRALGAMK